ncbi:hypothetical protein FRC00_007187 [Tulasnella sp. 408]|nr:hypothetical protein FRC00_007187 [Tulasnella sp. 408]
MGKSKRQTEIMRLDADQMSGYVELDTGILQWRPVRKFFKEVVAKAKKGPWYDTKGHMLVGRKGQENLTYVKVPEMMFAVIEDAHKCAMDYLTQGEKEDTLSSMSRLHRVNAYSSFNFLRQAILQQMSRYLLQAQKSHHQGKLGNQGTKAFATDPSTPTVLGDDTTADCVLADWAKEGSKEERAHQNKDFKSLVGACLLLTDSTSKQKEVVSGCHIIVGAAIVALEATGASKDEVKETMSVVNGLFKDLKTLKKHLRPNEEDGESLGDEVRKVEVVLIYL